MFDIDDLPALRDIIRTHNLRAEKKLGQNFLLDLNLTDKIVRSAGDLSQLCVFEIGPGPGGLTRSLIKSKAEKIIAVEYDKRAVAALQDLIIVSKGRLDVIQGDALDINLGDLTPKKSVIVANLPYNIATPLLIGWLKNIHEKSRSFERMILMFQKEVAQRLVAVPRTKAYGRLSVLTQWLCEAKILFDVPASAFTPPPKVTSSIVELKPKSLDIEQPSFDSVEKITASAFGQRRKMIRSSLKNYQDQLDILKLDQTQRAEELNIEDFISLASVSS